MLSSKFKTLLEAAEYLNFTKGSGLSLADPAGGQPSHQPAGGGIRRAPVYPREKRAEPDAGGRDCGAVRPEIGALYNRLQKELSDTEKQPVKLCVGLTHTAESNLTTEVLGQVAAARKALYHYDSNGYHK